MGAVTVEPGKTYVIEVEKLLPSEVAQEIAENWERRTGSKVVVLSGGPHLVRTASTTECRHALAKQVREMAVQEFDTRGPSDPRGAAIWDVAAWLDEAVSCACCDV